ncbi:MAG: DUF6382 domain-containing protein [Wujia sp.]
MEMYYGSKGIDNYLDVKLGYIRELSKNGISYQVTMLGENNITGLIKPSIREIDGIVWLRYCSNSFYVLDRLFMRSKPDWSMTRLLLEQICRCAASVEDYLINPDDIVLSSEYMFYSPEKRELRLICVPGYSVNLRSQIRSFLEYIMSRFDIRDRDGIARLYDLHERVNEEDFNLRICQMSDNINSDLEGQLNLEYEENNTYLKNMDKHIENNKAEKPSEYRDIEEKYSGIEEHKVKAKKYSIVLGLVVVNVVIILMIFGFSKYIVFAIAVIAVVCIYMLFAAKGNMEFDMVGNSTDKLRKNIYGDIDETESGCNTETDIEKMDNLNKPVKKLIPLTNGALPELYINEADGILTIGRDRESSSYSLNTTQISRVHACIYKENSNVFLEDCNSTNGTYINYRRIPALEPVKVHSGDIVGFANEEFYVS